MAVVRVPLELRVRDPKTLAPRVGLVYVPDSSPSPLGARVSQRRRFFPRALAQIRVAIDDWLEGTPGDRDYAVAAAFERSMAG